MTAKNRDHPPPKEKAALAGGDLERNQCRAHFTHETEKRKWQRDLEWALDAVLEPTPETSNLSRGTWLRRHQHARGGRRDSQGVSND